jgi:hypothetical protein
MIQNRENEYAQSASTDNNGEGMNPQWKFSVHVDGKMSSIKNNGDSYQNLETKKYSSS